MPGRRDAKSDDRTAPPRHDLRAASALQAVPTHRGRVLFLSGHWSLPGDAFTFEAMITVAADGVASGPIWWTRARGARLTGTEDVRGLVSSRIVRLDGVRTDPGLARDRYRIQLSAADGSGVFTGNSRAFGGWNGRMDGAFEFWTGRTWST
jgi:hypothetical protein